MCKYSNLKPNTRVSVNRTKDGYCDNCGSTIDFIGSKRYAIYVGHVMSTRYGVCDRFNYEQPVICLSCGESNNHTLVPCDSGFDGNALREKVEVEREGYRTRN